MLLAGSVVAKKCAVNTTSAVALIQTTTVAPVQTTTTVAPTVLITTGVERKVLPTEAPKVVLESDICDYEANKGRVHQWKVCNGVDYFVCGNAPFPSLIKMKCSAGTKCSKNPISTWPDIDCHW